MEGQTDFIHRSFQEYLAATEAIDTNDFGMLIAGAYTDVWTDVVVMAAGHASVAKRAQLLRGLLDRSARIEQPRIRDSLRLVAVACLETSPELPPELRTQISQAAASLLPPKSIADARSLARAGTFTLELLARTKPRKLPEVIATIHAATEIGDPAALRLIARFGKDARKTVFKELLRAWPHFDPEEYAHTVLADSPLCDGSLKIDDVDLIAGLLHLRRLRYLVCEDHGGDLSFVPRLPELRRLWTNDRKLRTLAPLAGSQLVHFGVGGYADPGAPPLDLTPLATATSLEIVQILSRRVINIGALAQMAKLIGVWLSYLGSVGALAELSPLVNLRMLSIGHMEDLVDLRPVAFLHAPLYIGIEGCPIAVDHLGFFSRWAETLERLTLWDLPAVDARSLAELRRLRHLSISGSRLQHGSALAALPQLTTLATSPETTELSELRGIPSLRVLDCWSLPGSEIDLTPLAGVQNLTVRVDTHAVVHGEDRLGPGTRVHRR